MATLTLAVDGIGSIDGFTLAAGATKVAAVASPDDDNTSYLTDNTGQVQDLTFGTSALLIGSSISNVRITIRNKGAAGSAPNPHFLLVSAAPSSETFVAAGVDWASETFDFPLAPTGVQWNKPLIDNMSISLQSGGGSLSVTTIFATVTYTPAAYESRLPTMGVS